MPATIRSTAMATDQPRAATALTEAFFDLYPGEATEVLEGTPLEQIVAFLQTQQTRRAATALARLSPAVAADCLIRLSEEALRRILPALDPGDVAVALSRLDESDRERRLAVLDPALAKELRELMSYPEDSAGRMMDTRVVTFRPQMTLREVLNKLRASRGAPSQDIVVAGDDNKLVGLVSLADAVRADPRRPLEQLVRRTPVSVHAMSPREQVVDLLSRRDVMTLPVVDLEGRLLGVIRHDAQLVQAVQEEATADLQTMVGASKEERALSPPSFAVRKRLPWLNINLLTAFLAAAVVGLFEGTIAKFTALAVLLPVVAGQSGNTGAQALAVTMRGLALREIRVRHWLRVLAKEFVAGAVNGAAIAVVTGLGVLIWSRSLGLAFVIALAMVLSMAIASVSGAAVPLLLTAVGQDPAQSSSIVLTTITDVMGFFSFLGLATLFASLL
jgi:magnesium transporter